MKNKKTGQGSKFSDETIASLVELGEVLKEIRDELVAEGKAKIVGGRLVLLDKDQ